MSLEMINPITRQQNKYFFSSQVLNNIFLTLICTAGVILRLREYLTNRSLWLDEAYLALNLTQQSFSDLLQYTWGTPIGFLWSSKALTTIGGNGELVLRLIPFITSILAIPLFYILIRKFIKEQTWILFTLLLFIVSDRLLYFSAEFKPYASDVFFSLLLSLIGINLIDNPQSKRAGVFGIVSGAMLLFSFPSLFISITVLIIYILKYVLRRDWKQLSYIALPSLTIIISIAIYYFLFLRAIHDNTSLIQFWGNAFLPTNKPIQEVLHWLWDQIKLLFADPGGFRYPLLALGFSIIGIINTVREKNFTGLMPLVILIGLFLASALTIYPFSSRLLLFYVPFLFIWVGAGFAFISTYTRKIIKPASYVIAASALIFITNNSLPMVLQPHLREEVRPLMEIMDNQWKDGDKVYLYYTTSYAFRYYQELFNLNYLEDNYMIGTTSRKNPLLYLDDLDQIRNFRQVWLLFSHVYNGYGVDERQYMLDYVDTFAERVESYSAPGAYLYLYSIK